MLNLLKIFLSLLIALVLGGNSLLAGFISAFCFVGVDTTTNSVPVSTQTFEGSVGFGFVKGNLDRTKWEIITEGSEYWNANDSYCLAMGEFVGYINGNGTTVESTVPDIFAYADDSVMLYDNRLGVVHIGFVSGGDNSTDYKEYIITEFFQKDPTNFTQRASRQSSDNADVRYSAYYWRDNVYGKDYTLETYTNADNTGCIYAFSEVDYTLTRETLSDNLTFYNFDSDKSYPMVDAVASYRHSDSSGGYLISASGYNGDWSSGLITVDGTTYNLRADSLRVLEEQGVIPYSPSVAQYGYDSVTTGGEQSIDFVFGKRVITLVISTQTDGILRDASIKGFSANINYNMVTDADIQAVSGVIQGSGNTMTDEDFHSVYLSEPYIANRNGVVHYYAGDGTEITAEEYAELCSLQVSEEVTEVDNSVSDNTVSDNEIETETEIVQEDTTSENSVGFIHGSAPESVEQANVAEENEAWLMVGGLTTRVTLASLDVYIADYSTSHNITGSSNELVYTVTKSTSQMIFTLTNSEYITSIKVTY